MTTQKLALALSAINLVLLALLLGNLTPPAAAQDPADDVAPVLRGHKLEIVDDHGRVRAEFKITDPQTVDGRLYPEAVLLRLIDPDSGPVVKLQAAKNGAGLSLSDAVEGGVQILAQDAGNFVKVYTNDGKEQIVRP